MDDAITHGRWIIEGVANISSIIYDSLEAELYMPACDVGLDFHGRKV
jgi:hypothetical protein